jgi:hypothetical protein
MPQFIFVPRHRAGPDRDAAKPLTAAATAARAPDLTLPEQPPALDAGSSHVAQHQRLTAEQQQQHQQATFIRQLVGSWRGSAYKPSGTDTRDTPTHCFAKHDGDNNDYIALLCVLQDIQDFALISRQRVTLLPGLNVVSAALVRCSALVPVARAAAELGENPSDARCR